MWLPHRQTTVGMRLLGAVIVAALALSACSFGTESPADAAEQLIAGELAESMNLEFENVSCADPGTDAVGTTFPCTATLLDLPAEFEVLIDAEDHIIASVENIVTVEAQQAIGGAIADEFARQGVTGLTADSIDCGGEMVLLGSDRTMLCALTEPETGDVYDTAIRINDVSDLVFDFTVADEPRP